LSIVEICEPIIRKEKISKVTVNVNFLKINQKWIRTRGDAIIYIINDSYSKLLCYGDRLIMNSQFIVPEGPQNPGGFDNRSYLKLKGIYYQTYVKSNHWRFIPGTSSNPLFHLALCWRDNLLMILRNNGIKGRELAVAGALLLGDVDDVDRPLLNDYASTGVIHILSVSGMHVGMIFLILEKLLAFFEKRKNGSWIKALVIVSFIWIYALITGLSPAVMRAAAMLSLIVSSRTMKRQPDILNILAASVILLLIWRPLLLADPGFQLSYLAVAGIVIFYKPVHNIYIPVNLILDKVWSIIAVSVAAQILTIPVCLYYFNQFPNYFIITNIIVIPLSNMIIYTGIMALAVGHIPWLSLVIARLLSVLVWTMNTIIHWIGGLPFSVMKGIVVTFPQTVVIFLIIITGTVFLFKKSTIWLFIQLSFAILLSATFLYERYYRLSGSSFIVYNIRGKSLCDFIIGGRSILVGNTSSLTDPYFGETFMKTRYNKKLTGLFQFENPPPYGNTRHFSYGHYFYKSGGFIILGKKKIIVINKKIPDHINIKLALDYVVVSGNVRVTMKEILNYCSPGMVVLDSSNPRWKAMELMHEAKDMHVSCYDVSMTGAYSVDY
jgi:competence protein ComEC